MHEERASCRVKNNSLLDTSPRSMRYHMDGPSPAARSGPDETRDRIESKAELGNGYLEEANHLA